MRTTDRSSGLRIITPDDVQVSSLVKATPRKSARGGIRLSATGNADEAEDILAALRKREFSVVDRIEFKGDLRSAKGTGKRKLRAAEGGSVRVEVPVQPSEAAIMLLEQDGMYTWQLAGQYRDGALPKTARRGAGKPPGQQRNAVFEIEISRDADTSSPQSKRRNVVGFVWGRVRTYVLKFAADIVIKQGVKFQERDVRNGYVDMNGPDPTQWPLLDSLASLDLPDDRPPRLLLFVHGTFSSTVGGFGALAVTPWGKAFLAAASAHYDAIIGFDHPTLSVDPLVNASAMLDGLGRRKWKMPPQIDIVAHSRGGLVVRSLVEKLLPSSRLKAEIGRVVFVACTNAGTLLAEPGNWKDLVDLYTNLTAGVCRVLALFPQTKVAARILDEVIASVGTFVKLLAVAAATGKDAPGIAAMEPKGPFVEDINRQQAGQPTVESSNYFVIESNFEAKLIGNDDPQEFSKRFKQLLANGFVDRLMQDAANDLVVNTSSMGAIDVDIGKYVKDTYDFGTNPHVYHTNYFTRPETANALARWLGLPPPASKVAQQRRVTATGAPAKRRGTKPVAAPSPAKPIVPASVDTDILVVRPDDRWGTTMDAISKAAPSYVVVERYHHGELLSYALRSEELLKLKIGKRDRPFFQALDYGEQDASPRIDAAQRMQSMAPVANRRVTRSRQVVWAGERIVGVLPEQAAFSPSIEMAGVAKRILKPQTSIDRVMRTRALPTFAPRIPIVLAPSVDTFALTPAVSAPKKKAIPKKATPKKKAIPEKGAPKKKAARQPVRKKTAPEKGGGIAGRRSRSPDIAQGVGLPSSRPVVRPAAKPSTRQPSRERAKGSAAAKHPTEIRTATCHIHAAMDESVIVNTVATVEVTVSRAAIEKALGVTSAGGETIIELDRKILVKVVPKLNFSMSRDEQGIEIDPPELKKPKTLSFEVKATDLGDGEVWVAFSQGQVQLALLKLYPTIVRKLAKAPKTIRAESATIDAPALGQPLNVLNIVEQINGNQVMYRFEFESPALKIRDWSSSSPIRGDRQTYVAALYKRIEDRWVSVNRDAVNFAQELRAFGAELFDELVPSSLQKVLWKHRDAIKSVQVISTEPFIPWELVHLRDPAKHGMPEETRFLGQMGLIRWVQGAGENSWPVEAIKIRDGKAFYVAPDYPDPNDVLDSVKAEVKFLQDKFSAMALEAESGEVRKFISKPGRFDLLHFACHGDANSNDIADAKLLMAGRMENANGGPRYIEDAFTATVASANCNIQADDNSPMVVLNACQVGRLGYRLTSIGGFAQAFLKGGAGAFVGALWSVGDEPASLFTEAMYEGLLNKKTLAEATTAARAAAQKKKEATWLAYVVYGHPHMKISR